MLWDITTKFLPVQDLMRRQLSTKFEEFILKNDAATPLTISNFSRAWQAYFLSYTLQIWCENTSFKDVQMMCNNDFDTSSGFRFEKIWLSCTVHICSLYLTKPIEYQVWFYPLFIILIWTLCQPETFNNWSRDLKTFQAVLYYSNRP